MLELHLWKCLFITLTKFLSSTKQTSTWSLLNVKFYPSVSVWKKRTEMTFPCSWNTIYSFDWVLKSRNFQGRATIKCFQDLKAKQDVLYGNNPIESQNLSKEDGKEMYRLLLEFSTSWLFWGVWGGDIGFNSLIDILGEIKLYRPKTRQLHAAVSC